MVQASAAGSLTASRSVDGTGGDRSVALTHRLGLRLASPDGPTSYSQRQSTRVSGENALSVRGVDVPVSVRKPRVIGSPLEGDHWLAANGPDNGPVADWQYMGPGNEVVILAFAHVTECMTRQAEIEQHLLAARYHFTQPSPDRRNGHGDLEWTRPSSRNERRHPEGTGVSILWSLTRST